MRGGDNQSRKFAACLGSRVIRDVLFCVVDPHDGRWSGKLQSNDRMNRFSLRADPRKRENRLDIDKWSMSLSNPETESAFPGYAPGLESKDLLVAPTGLHHVRSS
jgi:hypothetical protein